MGHTLKPTLACNGECLSCYETEIRSHGLGKYDMTKILEAVNKIIKEEEGRQEHARKSGWTTEKCSSPCFHGGEPLLLKPDEFELLAKTIHDYWKRNNIQTNGLLISDKHIELFKKYDFSVGVSIDGDTAQLNRGRWNLRERSDQYIQEKTDLVLDNMRKLHKAGIGLSCIIVLRKYNASPENVDGLVAFIKRLYEEFGITSGRTNVGIVYDPEHAKEEQLTEEELGNAYIKIADYIFGDPKLLWHPYCDVTDMLLGYLDQTCVFNQCDPFNTPAEKAIDHNGVFTNCLHTGMAVDGIHGLRADQYATDRYPILSQTPQELGGCKDCRYWHMCYGGCPGAGIDNDWRNRCRFCGGYKVLFDHAYKILKGIIPNLLLTPDLYPHRSTPEMVQASLRKQCGSTYRRKDQFRVEQLVKATRSQQARPSLGQHGDSHGDSHGDRHGDAPHGDHTDRK